MKIIGLQSGAVLQRNIETNACSILLQVEFSGTPLCDVGTLAQVGNDKWCLEGIGVGGPYTVTISDDTDTVRFSDIYVGDVWLLAGQSNMEGAGWIRAKDEAYTSDPAPVIRAFYMDDTWRPAVPQLHQLWESKDPAHRRAFSADEAGIKSRGLHVADFPPAPQKRGVGPGFFFAEELYRQTGIPQGVIPCAVGGAPIEMWIPKQEEDNYYSAAYRRIIACGQRIRGIFWYQGEGFHGTKEAYKEMFEAMRQGFSRLCEKSDLPAIMVQTFRSTIPGILNSAPASYIWSRFREYLRDFSHECKNVAVVATNDLELDDCIHLSADAQEKLGKRAADAMLYLADNIGCPEPEIESMTIYPHACVTDWSELRIRYCNLRGNLTAIGFASGFMISEGDELPSEGAIQHISLIGNEVHIRFELTPHELRKKILWYGFGHSFHCSIIDEGGHPLLSQGPIPLLDVEIIQGEIIADT